MTPSCVLLDLDGTLVDSAAGVTAAVAAALRTVGADVPDEQSLRSFIGPPMYESFRQVVGLNEETARRALAVYRAEYAARALDGRLYEGVSEMLAALTAEGLPLAVATSKVEDQAERVLRHHGLDGRLAAVCGIREAAGRTTKRQVIRECVARLRARGVDTARPVMVGDRAYDVRSAAAEGIPAVHVLWGYGGPAESAGAIASAAGPGELTDLLTDLPAGPRIAWAGPATDPKGSDQAMDDLVSTPLEPRLWAAHRELTEKVTYTDLTHAFHPGQPHFPAFPDERREMPFDMARGDGFNVHRYTIVGQWGTHVDPPVHFVNGGRTLDEIPVDEMILPLVVLDITHRVETDSDAVPTLDDVFAWEARHGRIPSGAFVALRTGWSSRWPDAAAMANRDANGVSHCPGWSAEVLRHLFEEAGVTAIGHEQTDTDPGVATSAGDFSLELYVLERDRWQIELMTGLDQVPEAGALIVATWPKPQGGSGFPARVFALHRAA